MKYIAIFCIFLCSCYNLKKATVQHGRAVATFPLIEAQSCAEKYPPKQIFIRGKDSIIQLTDTLWADDGNVFHDTVYSKTRDTVYIHTEHQLPGRVINNTFVRVDTVYQTNTAALAACEIQKNNAISALTKEQARADKYKYQARIRLWLLIAIAAGGLVWLYFKFTKK